MGQTVNLLAYAFGGSNPSLPTQRFKKRVSDFAVRNSFFLITTQVGFLPEKNQFGWELIVGGMMPSVRP